MEPNQRDERERLDKLMEEVEGRVEALRKQALCLKQEKESILELLQDVQDAPNRLNLSNDAYDDIEYNLERLIVRCLTVEVSVVTPRNESQEDAYTNVSAIVEDLQIKLQTNPLSHRGVVESHLNACLPEPVSSNINLRFQEKLLGCTVEDQKHFRNRLEKMMQHSRSKVEHISKINSYKGTDDYVNKDGKVHTDTSVDTYVSVDNKNGACKGGTDREDAVVDGELTNGQMESSTVTLYTDKTEADDIKMAHEESPQE